MNKEILFLSDPSNELRRVDTNKDKGPWFNAGDLTPSLERPEYDVPLDPFAPPEDFITPPKEFIAPPEDFIAPPKEFIAPPEDFIAPSEDFIAPASDLDSPDPDLWNILFSPERENYGDADEIHDNMVEGFSRPGNRLSVEGILMVSHSKHAYEEYLIDSREQSEVTLKADSLDIPYDLHFQIEREDGKIWLLPVDNQCALFYRKKFTPKFRLFDKSYFSVMLLDNTVLEMTFRPFSPMYDSYRSYALPAGKTMIRIGRREKSDICCVCPCFDEKHVRVGDLVSREAARIKRYSSQAVLEDTSGHGIYVNGKPVPVFYPLEEGDVITFWNCRMIWHVDRIEVRDTEDIKVRL